VVSETEKQQAKIGLHAILGGNTAVRRMRSCSGTQSNRRISAIRTCVHELGGFMATEFSYSFTTSSSTTGQPSAHELTAVDHLVIDVTAPLQPRTCHVRGS
jgi:hypothetical protein